MSDDDFSEPYDSDRDEEEEEVFSNPIRSKTTFTGDIDDADDIDEDIEEDNDLDDVYDQDD